MPYSGTVMESPCSIPQAFDYNTRLANAKLVNSKLCQTAEGFGPNVTVLIDDVTPHNATGNNPVWCQYGQGPNMGFVIAQNGTVVLESEWFAGSNSGPSPVGAQSLSNIFTSLNTLLGTKECLNQCDLSGNTQLCSNQTCAELVKKYPCDAYYAPGKAYAGWCDRECGYGTCADH